MLIARKAEIESSNIAVVTSASTSLSAKVEGLNHTLLDFKAAQDDFVRGIRRTLSQFTEREVRVGRFCETRLVLKLANGCTDRKRLRIKC